MEKIVIADLGVEGGGATIYGSEVDGAWSFWQEGTSMFLDDNDDEDWRSWSSEPVTQLAQALPDDWIMMYPIEINESFLQWFRDEYEAQNARLLTGRHASHERHLHPRWQEVLFLTESVHGSSLEPYKEAMKTIYLVACAKRKRQDPAAAKDLYISQAFRKSRAYAERHGDCWYILSAKHHLLSPECVIEDYDLTLNTMSKKEQSAWADIVLTALKGVVQPGDKVVFLAGNAYRKNLEGPLTAMGYQVEVPMRGLNMYQIIPWLNAQEGKNAAQDGNQQPESVSKQPARFAIPAPDLQKDIDRFYALLWELDNQLGGKRQLKDCTGSMTWPKGGVYFFFEEGEYRHGRPEMPRVVRVGTHALSERSKTILWSRLRQHKGSDHGGGHHRGSIFRSHVGAALIKKQGCQAAFSFWKDPSAKKEITDAERPMECEVSERLGRMPFLWLAVDTRKMRDRIERNSIALLSNRGNPVDPQSADWLGNSSAAPAIRQSGLWNVMHTKGNYDPSFLDDLENQVKLAAYSKPIDDDGDNDNDDGTEIDDTEVSERDDAYYMKRYGRDRAHMGDQPDILTAEDEAILDRVWERNRGKVFPTDEDDMFTPADQRKKPIQPTTPTTPPKA